jgi:hypothetical protein
MSLGDLIELRLQQRRCIKCGLNAAIDWPYICDDCMKALAKPRPGPNFDTPSDPKV